MTFLLILTRLTVVALCLLQFTLPVKAQEPRPLTDTTNAPEGIVIPMRYDPPRIPLPLIRASVNGAPPRFFVVDTGASGILLLTTQYARSLKLVSNGTKARVNGEGGRTVYAVQSLQVWNDKDLPVNVPVELMAVEADVPLSSLAPRDTPVVGIIGLPLFATVLAQFDWSAQRLTLYPGATFDNISDEVQKLALLPSSDGHLRVSLPAKGGETAWFILDTGSVITSLPDKMFLSLPASASRTTVLGMVHGMFWEQVKIVTDFPLKALAGKSVEVSAQTQRTARANGFLGMSVLSRYFVILDMKNNALYLLSNKEEQFDFRDGMTGVSLKAAHGRLIVARVRRETSGGGSPIQIGDELVSVDGASLEGESDQVAERIMDGKAGTTASLVLKRPDATVYTASVRRSDRFPVSTAGQDWDRGLTARRLNGKLLEVLSVLPQTPLARAGVQGGDQVVAINGKRISALSLSALRDIWRMTKVHLQIVRKGALKPINLTVSDEPPRPKNPLAP